MVDHCVSIRDQLSLVGQNQHVIILQQISFAVWSILVDEQVGVPFLGGMVNQLTKLLGGEARWTLLLDQDISLIPVRLEERNASEVDSTCPGHHPIRLDEEHHTDEQVADRCRQVNDRLAAEKLLMGDAIIEDQ